MINVELVATGDTDNGEDCAVRRNFTVETIHQAVTTASVIARNATGERLLAEQTVRETETAVNILYWADGDIVAYANITEIVGVDPTDGPPF